MKKAIRNQASESHSKSRSVRELCYIEVENGIFNLKASDCRIGQAAVYVKASDRELTKAGITLLLQSCLCVLIKVLQIYMEIRKQRAKPVTDTGGHFYTHIHLC